MPDAEIGLSAVAGGMLGRTQTSPPAGAFPPTMRAMYHRPPGRPTTIRQ